MSAAPHTGIVPAPAAAVRTREAYALRRPVWCGMASSPEDSRRATERERGVLEAEISFYNIELVKDGPPGGGTQSPSDGATEIITAHPARLPNGRLLPPTPPVRYGFALRSHRSRVGDWYDYQHVQTTLYPEYENLLRALVPEASHVLVRGLQLLSRRDLSNLPSASCQLRVPDLSRLMKQAAPPRFRSAGTSMHMFCQLRVPDLLPSGRRAHRA